MAVLTRSITSALTSLYSLLHENYHDLVHELINNNVNIQDMYKLRELYQVGDKAFTELIYQGIYSIKDLASKFDTILNHSKYDLTREIIHINLQEKYFCSPSYINTDAISFSDWVIFDIEYMCLKGGEYHIYSISGIDNNGTIFKQAVNGVSDDEQKKLITDYIHYSRNKNNIHYSHADVSCMRNVCSRLGIDFNLDTCDLHKFLIDNRICFKGSYNMKLKNIEKAFIDQGLLTPGVHCPYNGHVLAQLFKNWYEHPSSFDMNEMDKILEYNVNDVLITKCIYKFILDYYGSS